MNRRIVLPSRVVSLCCLIVLIPTFAASSHAEQTDALVLGLGKTWETPIYVNDSGRSGPTVIVTGGVHGNEPAGASAAEQIINQFSLPFSLRCSEYCQTTDAVVEIDKKGTRKLL